MTPGEHMTEAETLLALAGGDARPYAPEYLTAAQVNATLAVAGHIERMGERVQQMRDDLATAIDIVLRLRDGTRT